jgi:DNA-binding NarL/FixJ family response regulator
LRIPKVSGHARAVTERRRLRLAIVEDESLYLDLLATVLGIDPELEVVGTYTDADAALREVPRLQPDVALLDIELGGSVNGVQLGLLLRERLPQLGIVLLSNVRAPRLLGSIPRAQVSGWSYLLKRSVRDASILRRAIDGAAQGLVTLDPALVVGRRARERGRISSLTERQRSILELVAEGWTNEAIAARLGIAVKTVENQLVLTYQELGVDRERDPIHPRVRAVLLYLVETKESLPLAGALER